jgi:photosynthetic reaction center cytochrome c subunit
MRERLRFTRTTGGACGLALATALFAFGQQQEPQPLPTQAPAGQGQARTAEQQYKNIKVLTGTPAAQLNLAMHGISGALGVDCVHCHVWEQFDKDVKPTKEVARRMITMVRQLNEVYFGGQQVITCYTCHRGSTRPVGVRMIPDTTTMRGLTVPPPPLPTEEIPKPDPSYPSAHSLLDKYVEALGGEAALRKVTSRMITAKRDYPAGPAGLQPMMAQVEIDQQAPNLTVMFSKTEKFAVSEGFDGQAAWAQGVSGNVNNLPEPDQQRAKRSADFYESLDLAKNYGRMEVAGIEKVNGKDTFVVVAYPQNDIPESLYFDTKTGLLLRRLTTLPSSLGPFPYAVDYDEYKKTSKGVMFPFVIRMTPSSPRNEASTNSTIQILQVRENVSIDASRFAKPAPKALPGVPVSGLPLPGSTR